MLFSSFDSRTEFAESTKTHKSYFPGGKSAGIEGESPEGTISSNGSIEDTKPLPQRYSFEEEKPLFEYSLRITSIQNFFIFRSPEFFIRILILS